MDIVSPAVRSRMMSNIGGKNTKPELIVRSVAHALGLRFRLHDRKLPGTPDLVFRKHRAVVFVHGCFWHRHACSLAAVPKTRIHFWTKKFEANRHRDARRRVELEGLGGRVLEIWACETTRPAVVTARLVEFFRVTLANVGSAAGAPASPEAAELSAQSRQHRLHSHRA